MNNLMTISLKNHTQKATLLFQVVCFLCVMTMTSLTYAALTSVRVSPSLKLIVKGQDSTFNIMWQVASDPGHASGVSSPNARIINPQNGAVLSFSGGLLSDGGSGPFNFNETVVLPARDTDLWFNQGLKRVILKRSFSDPAGGAVKEAQLTLQLGDSSLSAGRESTSGELNVLGLNFEFENGNTLTQIDQDTVLKGTLTLNYTGAGLLEGRWQIAEPAGSYDEPLYRTLALVRKNLSANQRSSFKSPELPTIKKGKYLVRFCVTNRNMDTGDVNPSAACPSSKLVVTAAYQVRGTTPKLMYIRDMQPNQQAVDKDTAFSWSPLPQTTVYQLQFFELVPTKASLASSRETNDTVQPEFVVGMMLQGSMTHTPLSELVLSKLQHGKRYIWRVTAHDQMGHLVGGSHEATFTYLQNAGKYKQNDGAKP